MSITKFEHEDRLRWRFVIVDEKPDFYESPGIRFDPPRAWVDAVVAVARDLRCFRYGRDVQPHLLVWELSIDDEYAVTIGWNGTRGISGFSLGDGQSMDASFAQAAAWVADTVQTELAGYDFVQWPSQGRYLLVPRQIDGTAVWLDPHTGSVIAQVGELSTSANW